MRQAYLGGWGHIRGAFLLLLRGLLLLEVHQICEGVVGSGRRCVLGLRLRLGLCLHLGLRSFLHSIKDLGSSEELLYENGLQ